MEVPQAIISMYQIDQKYSFLERTGNYTTLLALGELYEERRTRIAGFIY
jgi:hypothetical protein